MFARTSCLVGFESEGEVEEDGDFFEKMNLMRVERVNEKRLGARCGGLVGVRGEWSDVKERGLWRCGDVYL